MEIPNVCSSTGMLMGEYYCLMLAMCSGTRNRK